MEYNKKQILDLYENEKNKTFVAQEYCRLNNIEYSDSKRRMISKIVNSEVVDSDLENSTETDTNQYKTNLSNMPSAWCSEKNRFYSIEEFCDVYGLDKNSVKSSKLVSHNQSHMTYNIAFFTEDEEAVLDVDKHLEETIQKYIKPLKIETNSTLKTDWFDRLVYTDVHVAMDVNGKNGQPLYDGKWDREELLNRLTQMYNHVLKFKSSKTLIIDDLGDFMDGLGAQTTRKGHLLPQNMTDAEAFDLALEFKISLIDSLVEHYDTIICNDLTCDNHSAVFSYFVSTAVKGVLEQRYPNKVFVNTIKRFMHNYAVGNHTFVIFHGKDDLDLKFGYKPQLDAVQIEKLDQYCKENKLYNGNYIEFSKGDSHRALYDDTTSNDFQYYNYPAFSPPSNWVKTSFKNSKSGFRFYNINKTENIKIAIPYWF